MPSRLLLACLLALVTWPLQAGVIEIAAWNTVNRPNNAAQSALFSTVLSGIGDTTSRRLSILAISETDQDSAPAIAEIMNSIYGTTAYRSEVSTANAGDRTGFVFDTSAVSLLDRQILSSELTHPVLFARFQPVDLPEDLYVYSVHLKSGDGTGNSALRGTEATVIRDHADALGDGSNVVVLGDFNMHGSSEPAWSALVGSGNAALTDLANAPGEWRDNPAFLHLHTQDPRTSMDDRFDIAFASGELFDGQGIDYTPSSFRVFGNNGTHLLNQPITTGTGASSEVLLALSMASDHLPMVAQFNYSAIQPPTVALWNIDANGEWFAAANWSEGIPNGTSARAVFGSIITQPHVVTVNTPTTVARMDFDNSKPYTIDGSKPLTLEAASGDAEINVVNGSHTIGAPVTLADNMVISVGPAASNLSITAMATSGVSLTKAGAGTLTVNNVRAAGLTVNDGTVAVAANGTASGTSVVGGLSIAGDATPTARLDLTNNAAIMDYDDASPVGTVRSQVLAGRGRSGLGATWNGQGITSSAAAAANAVQPESRSIGYADNSALRLGPYTTFSGQTVDDTSVLIAFTRTGDVNLDGVVDDDDVTIIGATYAPGVPQPSWALGDLDFNGFVDDDDVTLLGVFYDPTAAPLLASALSTGVSAVPEPSSLAASTVILGMVLIGAIARPRRTRSR